MHTCVIAHRPAGIHVQVALHAVMHLISTSSSSSSSSSLHTFQLELQCLPRCAYMSKTFMSFAFLLFLLDAYDIAYMFFCLQAAFGACARIVVRDLRRTETTDIIMVYSGTMHCICAIVACITVPRSVVVLQHTWQVVTLLLTGDKQLNLGLYCCLSLSVRRFISLARRLCA